ncbi:histidine phosphatase family protein [Pedobacter nutrimenti]|uniref:histidine phosphatase family protein n=1 Tax=Pedobacter nutrimenti TaxID=1241337 RepID=UPI00292EF644|nr:histidine phosphatase family protein [Pedobacter nutrimenti]
MKEIWFIRHGESIANAGIATMEPASIPLTQWGHQQAFALRDQLEKCPDLFIMTPYLRTQQTAMPSLVKFPKVRVEIWPLHEYDYLAVAQCVNTTAEQRRPWVSEYWDKCDPDFIHGKGAESFNGFSQRVINGLSDLQNRKEQFIVLFVHGQVIRAIWQYLATGDQALEMDVFRDKMLGFEVPNTSVFKCVYKKEGWQILAPSLTLHS